MSTDDEPEAAPDDEFAFVAETALLPPAILRRRGARIAKLEAASDTSAEPRTRPVDDHVPTMREILVANGVLPK